MSNTRKEPILPYIAFTIALYAQWLDQLQKLFTPAQSFTWVRADDDSEKKS